MNLLSVPSTACSLQKHDHLQIRYFEHIFGGFPKILFLQRQVFVFDGKVEPGLLSSEFYLRMIFVW